MTEKAEILQKLVSELTSADQHLRDAEVSEMFRTSVLDVRQQLSKLRDTARARLNWAIEQEKKNA